MSLHLFQVDIFPFPRLVGFFLPILGPFVHMTLSYVSDLLLSITYINPTPLKGECHRLRAKPQSWSIYVGHEGDERPCLYSA